MSVRDRHEQDQMQKKFKFYQIARAQAKNILGIEYPQFTERKFWIHNSWDTDHEVQGLYFTDEDLEFFIYAAYTGRVCLSQIVRHYQRRWHKDRDYVERKTIEALSQVEV